MLERPAILDPVRLLTPVLVELGRLDETAVGATLWAGVVGFLKQRSGVRPLPPQDWRVDTQLDCRCPDCSTLAVFLRDPQRQSARFPLRKDRRQHLHQAIDRTRLHLTHTTERKGSPQVLVCTKTRGGWTERCAEYRTDLAALRQLLGTPWAEAPDASEQRRAIEEALASGNGFEER